MARHKTPTAKKKTQGTYRDYRENLKEPEPKGSIGDAPEHLTDEQRDAWDELVLIAPAGVLGDSDRIILEITARLLAELRKKVLLPSGQMSHLIGCLARMGLTPSDRTKMIPQGNDKKKDPWDEKFGGKLKAVK